MVAANEEGIKEVKKEEFSPDTSGRLPTLFIRSSAVSLPIKALLFFISFKQYETRIHTIRDENGRLFAIHLGLSLIKPKI
jgi:hypothetical protein